MRKMIFITFFGSLFTSCLNQPEKTVEHSQETKSILDSTGKVDIKTMFNSLGDTDAILLQYRDLFVKTSYYKSHPQFITVHNKYFGNGRPLNEFIQENKGLYMSISDGANINAFGAAYPNGRNGIDVMLDSATNVAKIKLWESYKNDGTVYDFSEVKKGRLKGYVYKDGELVDSFSFYKK